MHALARAATGSPDAQPTGNSERHAPAATLAVRAAMPVLETFLAQRRPEGDQLFGIAVACNTESLDAPHAVSTAWRDGPPQRDLTDEVPGDRRGTAAILANRFELQGLSFTLSSGSSASADALVTAANAIRSGRVDRMLVISVEVNGVALRGLLAGDRALASLAAAGVLEGATAVAALAIARSCMPTATTTSSSST